MKKLLLLLLPGAVCLGTSCNNGGTMSTPTDSAAIKNIAVADSISNMFVTNNFSNIGNYMAPNCVDHASFDGKDIVGLDSIKATYIRMMATSKDMKAETVKVLADSQYVFQWLHFTWTNTTAFMSMAAGSKGESNPIEVTKYKNGKVTEHWEFSQPAEMMKMMAPPPPPAAPAPMDKKDAKKK